MPFQQHSPEADESLLPGEQAEPMVARLARAKMQAVLDKLAPSNSLVIGSDQAACFNGNIIGKPGSEAKAMEQLASVAGQSVTFYTSLCVCDAQSGQCLEAVEQTLVRFRKLTTQDIQNYVKADQPIDAAGSFRAEGLGIALFETISSDDPSSLIGLPLIKLTGFLNQMGVPVLSSTL